MVRTIDEMLVSHAMTRNPVVINPEKTALEAARLMRQVGVSALPVVDSNGRLVGIITERDFVWKIVAEEKPYSTPVSEFMTRSLIVVNEKETLAEALRLMSRFKIRHLPVVDDKGSLVGIISIRDIEAAVI
ncbi:MAG: CBS domain-containing protein [Desulfurococcales archaeon]|nr:CBS domain-containing protein [Desulfurococcales archaeon]